MPGPFDFLQNVGKDVSGAENTVGGWLKGLLPSQPAQPQNPPLSAPSTSTPLQGMSPAGGARVSGGPPGGGRFAYTNPQMAQQADYGQKVMNDQLGSLGQEFMQNFTPGSPSLTDPNNPVNQLRTAGAGLRGWEADTIQKGLNQTPLKNTPIPGTIGSIERFDPFGWASQVVNQNVVSRVQMAGNPEYWFAEDGTNPGSLGILDPTGIISSIGPGSGHNFFRDAFMPAVKAVTGEDVPHTSFYYQKQAQALGEQQSRLLNAQTQIDEKIQNGTATQAEIDAYNANYQVYNSQYEKFVADSQKSQNWWSNSNTAKTLAILGGIATFPEGIAAGTLQFAPQLLSDPLGTGQSMVSQVAQAAQFVQDLQNPTKRDNMSAQELTSNLSNIAMLGTMLFGGKKGAERLDRVGRDKTVQALQDHVPSLINRPGSAIDQAHEIQNAREASPVPESPDHVSTRIADLQRGLAEAQRQLHTETDPVMKRTLIEQTSGIADEIRNLQNQPRQAPVPEEDIRLGTAVSWDARSRALLSQIVDYTRRGEGDSPEAIRLYNQFRALEAGRDKFATMSDADLRSEYFSRFRDMDPEEQDSIMKEFAKRGITYKDLKPGRMQQKAGKEAVQATASEQLQELGPSKIAPEIQPEAAYPDYMGESKQVLGPNYHFLEPRPSDFSMNAAGPTRTMQTVEDFAKASPVEIAQAFADSTITPQIVDKWRGGSGWISPDGLAIPLANRMDESAHAAMLSEAGINSDGNESNTLMDNGWVKKSNIAGMVNFGVHGMTPAKIDLINRAIISDLRGGKPPYPYQIADELTGRPAIEVTPEEFAANGFDITPIYDQYLRRAGLITYTQGEQIGTPAQVSKIESIRADKQGRDSGFTQLGVCRAVANEIEKTLGFPAEKGMVNIIRADGRQSYIQHAWNRLPDGSVLDATADQFGHGGISVSDGTGYVPFTEKQQKWITRFINRNEGRGPDNEDMALGDFPSEPANRVPARNLKPIGEVYGTQSRGEAGQAGAPSERLNRPEGTPEGTALTATIQGPTGQIPVGVWEANPKPARTLPGGERAAQLEAKQQLIDSALKAATRVESTILRQILLRGMREEIDKIPPAEMAKYVEDRKRTVESVFGRIQSKYDPHGYIQHIVYENSEADAYFSPNKPRTITINPTKLLVGQWSRYMAKYFNDAVINIKDELSAKEYAAAKAYLDKWVNATQDAVDEETLAEEIMHGYDYDHPGISGVDFRSYLARVMTNPQFARAAYDAGFGPAEGQPFDESLMGVASRYLTKPNLISQAELDNLFSAITEYRANLLKIYFKTPLSGYSFRVPEVFRNEIRNPALIQTAVRAIGQDYEAFIKPRIASWVEAQKPSGSAFPAQPAVERGFAQAIAQSGVGPTGSTISRATSTGESAGLSGRNAGDQGSLSLPAKGEGISEADIRRLQDHFAGRQQETTPQPAPKQETGAVLQRTVMHQALTDLKAAGWPEGKRWELFARALNADPDSPEATEAYKILDSLPPKSQEIFMKAAEKLDPLDLQGSAMPIAQGREALPEVPSPATKAQIESPQFQYVQKELAAAQAKIEVAGPRIAQMEASGASLKDINNEKAGLADLMAYRDALQRGEAPQRAIAIGRDAYARTLLNLQARAKDPISAIPELDEEPYKNIFLGKKFSSVDPSVAESLVKRLRVIGYDGLRVDKAGNVNLAEFFDGLFAQDRVAEEAYKKLPQATKDYLRVKIGYRGVPFRGKKPKAETVPGQVAQEVAPGTENYINQTDLAGIGNVIDMVHQSTGGKGGFIVVRHGSTARNAGAGAAERMRGWDDIPLNDQGEQQAERLGAAFAGKKVAVIYASPMKRSLATAEAISKTTGAKVIVDENLKPWNIGDYSGKDAKVYGPELARLAKEHPDQKIPGGESFNDYLNRYIPAVQKHMQDALSQDGMTLEVNHTRGYRMVKSLVQSKGDPTLPVRDAVLDKSEIGPGGMMGLRNVNGYWQVAGDYISDPFDPTKKTWVNGEASQKFDVPQGEKPVETAAKTQEAAPAPKSLKEVYSAVDPMTASAKKNLKAQKAAEDKAAKIKGEISPMQNINSQIDNISADPAHPANASAVEAKVLRDMLPAAEDLGGAAYERIKSDYAAALQRFTSRMAAIAKEKPKAAEAIAPTVTDRALFDKTTKLAEQFRKRIDKGEDPDKVAVDAAKSMGMTRKQALAKLHDKNWGLGEGKNWAPAMQEILLGKAATKIRANRLANKPGRKTVPFEAADVLTHEPKMGEATPEKNSAKPLNRKPVPAIASVLNRTNPARGRDVPPDRVMQDAQKDVEKNLQDASKKTTKQMRDETEQIHKQINTPSPNPFAQDLFAAAKRINIIDQRAERRKAGLEEPGMDRKPAGGAPPKPPDGPGNILAGWDDARDPLRSFGGNHAKLAEVMDELVKHYAKQLDPGLNQLPTEEQYRKFVGSAKADIALSNKFAELVQKAMPDYKSNREFWHSFYDAVEESNDEKRAELKKSFTPEQAATVDAWRAYEQIKGRVKSDNDLIKAEIDHYLAHIMKFDENGKALLNKQGQLRPDGLGKGRLAYWRDRAIVTEDDVMAGRATADQIGQTLYPTISALRKEFGDNNVETDPVKIIKIENAGFSRRLRTHQMLEALTQHLVTPTESMGKKLPQQGKFTRLTSGKDILPYEGHPIVPISELENVPVQFRNQLDSINIGPDKSALTMYRVWAPLKDLMERQADLDYTGWNALGAPLRWANNVYKIYKFIFNPLHLYNVASDADAFMSNRQVPMVGPAKIWFDTRAILNGKKTWKTPIGELNGTQMISAMLDNGATFRDNIGDSASLGGADQVFTKPWRMLGKDLNVTKHFHNLMWVHGVWGMHIALTKHLADYYMKQLSDANNGAPLNESQFNHALSLAAEQSNKAVGFLDKMDMSRTWRTIGSTVNFANAWSTLQIRNWGGSIPKFIPGAKGVANFGGGERYLDTLTKILPEGGLTPKDMEVFNSVHAQLSRRFAVNGTIKLLVSSALLAYMGSYIAVLTGQPGAQISLPWDNFQKDPTHTFDVYGGIDPQTGKQIWYHNPLYNALSEFIDYGMGSIKAAQQGQGPLQVAANPFTRYASGKLNPFIGQLVSIATGAELGRWMEGYADPSIHNDPSVIAIENALSAKGINLPVGLEDRLIYAIREVGPVPGFAPTYSKDQALNNSGDVINAVGPGKWGGLGDFLNAMQSGDFSKLVPTDLGNLALFMLGSRQTETATPSQLVNDNQISQQIAQSDQKKALEKQMVEAAYKGDYKTVARISDQLQYDNNQLVNSLLHPPAGSGGGIAYHDTAYQSSSGSQDTLMGYTLSQPDTNALEASKKAHFLAMYSQISASPEWQALDGSGRAAMINSMNTQLMKAVENQYAQNLGIIGGAPITNQDIQGLIDNTLSYRAMVRGDIATNEAYISANPVEQDRIMKEYLTFADDIAYKSVFGAYKGVPPERVSALINDTIGVEEGTRQYLQSSVFYQMASPQDQARMLTEYGTLARTVSEKFALGQGQGPRGDIQLMASQVPMVIEKTIQVEETSKALLHSTDYYQTSDLATQQSLDSKYETLARSLAFSPAAYVEDPNIIVENSIMAEEQYFNLQNQFGGGNYIKLMAQQLSDMELTLRQGADVTPARIAQMQKALRAQFLAANPTYANYLRAKTAWSKYSPAGQIYTSLNNSEYAAQDQLAQADQLSNSVLTAGTSSDPYFDPATNMGLADLGGSNLTTNTSSALDLTQQQQGY